MFHKNPQHPALLCEQELKQDCVGAKRPPRNFKHPDLSPVSAFWKDCSSAFHWCKEAVRVFWSSPSAPDSWTAAAPRTPKEFLGVQGVQTCNRCGRGCWPWWGFVFQLEAVENLGTILLFRTAPIERLCAMPMCHWREALKWKKWMLHIVGFSDQWWGLLAVWTGHYHGMKFSTSGMSVFGPSPRRLDPHHGRKFAWDTTRIWHTISQHYLFTGWIKGVLAWQQRDTDAVAAQNIPGILWLQIFAAGRIYLHGRSLQLMSNFGVQTCLNFWSFASDDVYRK